MDDLHTRSVGHFTARGEHAAQRGACPLETWARDLRTVVDDRARFLASLFQIPAGEARGMALAGLVSGRPGSWEAAEVVRMARADFTPLVELASDLVTADLVSQWPTRQVDGGQVLADALARLAERGPLVPDESHFAGSSFARSTAM